MKNQPRLYDHILRWHLATNRQMAFVSGPRQVGKTTSCQGQADVSLNYDVPKQRQAILKGEEALLGLLPLKPKQAGLPVVLLDELHKHPKWRNMLKGLFDSNESRFKMLVTGSSSLDAFRRAGDALTGRYFSYRMHPLSVGELARQGVPTQPVRPPVKVAEAEVGALFDFGGFPEPFLRRDKAHAGQWRQRRYERLTREDARDLPSITMLTGLESLSLLLMEQSAQQLNMAALAKTLGVSPHTVKAWLGVISSLHWGFLLRPYSRQVTRSLRKEPKWYLRDWSGVDGPGARAETLVACHLLKAVEGWTDLGLGAHELQYIRDKEGREVDFVVTRKGQPWLLVEVKKSDTALHKPLEHFRQALKAPYAVQVVLDLPYQEADCFQEGRSVVAPARTFLSQLL